MAGRPPFKPTAAHRRKVAAAAAGGMTKDDIARALGISTPTLAKYFDTELSTGAAQRRLEVMDALFKAAKKGNVSAIRTVLALTPAAAPAAGAATIADAPAQGAPAAPGRAPRLGKKEQAQLAAVTAAEGTEWDGVLPSTGTVQ